MADYFLVSEPIDPKKSQEERKKAKMHLLRVSIIINVDIFNLFKAFVYFVE